MRTPPCAADLDFAAVDGLSNEVKQKLSAARPDTLARPARIPGVTPAAIALLLVYLKRRGALQRGGPAPVPEASSAQPAQPGLIWTSTA